MPFVFGLSRNHGSADKQERTVGRSKVVRKFLFRNFLPLKVKKPRYTPPVFWNLLCKFYFIRAAARYVFLLNFIYKSFTAASTFFGRGGFFHAPSRVSSVPG